LASSLGLTGVSAFGDHRPDERYLLAIDSDQVVLSAAEPVGVARGLTTLVQLPATAASTTAGAVPVHAVRILDAAAGMDD
jgi:N-acetyl-beta-hexosaminidase